MFHMMVVSSERRLDLRGFFFGTMPERQEAKLQQFQWQPCPEGQAVITRCIDQLLSTSAAAARLANAMRERSGTRFLDWIDHIVLPPDEGLAAQLSGAGFKSHSVPAEGTLFQHPGAIFPRLVFSQVARPTVAILVESVADFLATHGRCVPIEGIPHGRMRKARPWVEDATELWVVERHGYSGLEVPETRPREATRAQQHLEGFRSRPRAFASDSEAFQATEALIDRAVEQLGTGWAADLWFAGERDYWMRRNRAARVQKARQDSLGLGWANHDHHTYRCRRETFHHVIAIFEKLGCACRERFYAGAEAGWGAQVLEQEEAGIVIFADVDMAADEVTGDFAHQGFQVYDEEGRPEKKTPEKKPTKKLGTVGLWCALHGESFLEAGMHHLECQFDFDGLRNQLQAESGIGMMPPFTDFPYLRQQFTEGERWDVSPENVERLLAQGQISAAEAERFLRQGALGSHLENLERGDGFKGFNQTGINDIIARTDPRTAGAS